MKTELSKLQNRILQQAFLKIPMKISFLTLFNVITRMWKFNIRGSNHPVICGQGLKLFLNVQRYDSVTREKCKINFCI